MQLDVGVSPPADIKKFYYHLIPNLYGFRHAMVGNPDSLDQIVQEIWFFFLMNFCIVTSRQTESEYISTGGLKNKQLKSNQLFVYIASKMD